MKKDITRDYVTEILRAYARQETVAQSACIGIERSQDSAPVPPLQKDFVAVNNTFEVLDKSDKGYIASAIRAVYFVNPFDELHKGDVSRRVISFANSVYADERTVYRWLREGRQLCAIFRGLSVSV